MKRIARASLRIFLATALILPLSQCRCVKACVRFFKDHAASGHNSSISGNLPAQPLTIEQFIAANAHRGTAPEVLRSRFRVADADGDGWLTPDEIVEHRVKAARNKLGDQVE